MKALILAAEDFEDSELYYPLYRFQEEQIDVDVAAPERRQISGKHLYTIDANVTFAEVRPEDYDVLVIPGGKAPETVRLHDKAVAITRDMIRAGKLVAAICHGSQVLISAGVLEGRNVTCWPGVRDDVKAAGANYSDQEVVVDGNLVTSRCPSDLPAFCREIFRALKASG